MPNEHDLCCQVKCFFYMQWSEEYYPVSTRAMDHRDLPPLNGPQSEDLVYTASKHAYLWFSNEESIQRLCETDRQKCKLVKRDTCMQGIGTTVCLAFDKNQSSKTILFQRHHWRKFLWKCVLHAYRFTWSSRWNQRKKSSLQSSFQFH